MGSTSVDASDCHSEPELKLYSGYASSGQKSLGAAVIFLQKKLEAKGCDIGVDGLFGPNAERAVKRYQDDNNLSVDGIVGPETWGFLCK